MSIFSKILHKLGVDKSEPKEKPTEASPATNTKPAPKPVDVHKVTSGHSLKRPLRRATAKLKNAPAPMEMVDVMSKLESMSKGSGLNWRESIVDLLKVLEIDSSYTARKELAEELNCPAELMGDSAKMNIWLHKTVLNKIAENGGDIPQDLLD